jgi:spore maturation protein A
MLNHLWAGLIVASLLFALAQDIRDIAQDRYRNGAALPIDLSVESGADSAAKRFPVRARIQPDAFRAHFRVSGAPAPEYTATVERSARGTLLRFKPGESFPAPLSTIRDSTSPDDKELRGELGELNFADGTARTTVTFSPVRFVKLNAITTAAFEMAKTAVTMALGFVGGLALWLGVVRIAERSGLVNLVVIAARPLLRPLFPQIPPDHPAFGMITLSLAANVLGLGNAATPLGIKAMEELQKLNPTDDTATDPMVMFLAINTASVQIVPPATLVAIMGLEAGRIYFPMIFVTALGTIAAIVAVKVLGLLPGYRASNPDNLVRAGA